MWFLADFMAQNTGETTEPTPRPLGSQYDNFHLYHCNGCRSTENRDRPKYRGKCPLLRDVRG